MCYINKKRDKTREMREIGRKRERRRTRKKILLIHMIWNGKRSSFGGIMRWYARAPSFKFDIAHIHDVNSFEAGFWMRMENVYLHTWKTASKYTLNIRRILGKSMTSSMCLRIIPNCAHKKFCDFLLIIIRV